MHIILSRYRKKEQTIDGRLMIGGRTVCDTAENTLHALAPGLYGVIIHKCHQYSRKMPIICMQRLEARGPSSDVPHFADCSRCKVIEPCNINSVMPLYCPQIKPGNGVYNRTDGSIIVGKYIIPGCLKHPVKTFQALYDRMRRSSSRGHAIYLDIREEYTDKRKTSEGIA